MFHEGGRRRGTKYMQNTPYMRHGGMVCIYICTRSPTRQAVLRTRQRPVVTVVTLRERTLESNFSAWAVVEKCNSHSAIRRFDCEMVATSGALGWLAEAQKSALPALSPWRIHGLVQEARHRARRHTYVPRYGGGRTYYCM